MTYTFEYNLFSDLHKDAFGFRPRDHRFYSTLTTDEERQEDWDYVCKCLDVELERMKNAEIQSDIEFEDRILHCVACGADDRESAIRWILDGDDFSEMDFAYGFGYIQYEYGISDKYRDEVMGIINNKLNENEVV